MENEVTITLSGTVLHAFSPSERKDVRYSYVLSGLICPACMGFETPVQVAGTTGVELEHALYRRAAPCEEEAFEDWYEYICLGCGYQFIGPHEEHDDDRSMHLVDMLLAAQGRVRP